MKYVDAKMDVVVDILEQSAKDAEKYKPIAVNKHLELDYDLGTILAIDNNELDGKKLRVEKNEYLLNLTRDNVQLLLNRVWELPTEQVDEAIVVKLPRSRFVLPRAKPVPKPKALTKWEEFAKLKGIQKKKKEKLSWDEQLKKWVPLHGYKRAANQNEKEWVLEVPANANPMEDQFAKAKTLKNERIAKNELQRMRNIAKAKNIKVPRVGLTNPDVSSAKDLQAAITVARSSTASLGKFQDKLPKEKEARGVIELTPGATRKRKMPPMSSDQERRQNLDMVDSVLNKRPKIDIEKAVSRHLNQEQLNRSEEKKNLNAKSSKKSNKSIRKLKGKKPASGRGQRKAKGVGRKRR